MPDIVKLQSSLIDDAAFIAALGYEYRDATTIHRLMVAAGTPVTVKAIRQTMRDFVRFTGLVEARGASWRIIPDRLAVSLPQPSNDDIATMLPIGLHQSCGLELMRSLPDASIDLVLTDLPYGTTSNAIDPKIDVAQWMSEMRRVVTDRGAIVAFCTQPFTTDLMNAGRDMWKSEIVWEKPMATGFAQSRHRMMKAHESILVFSKGTVSGGDRSTRHMTFNPQGAEEVVTFNKRRNPDRDYHGGSFKTKAAIGAPVKSLRNCPRDVVFFGNDQNAGHPFAKPVALLEMLIRTYSNENGVVLDPTMGSGSTGLACLQTGRQFIGAENGTNKKGQSVFFIAEKRINLAAE